MGEAIVRGEIVRAASPADKSKVVLRQDLNPLIMCVRIQYCEPQQHTMTSGVFAEITWMAAFRVFSYSHHT